MASTTGAPAQPEAEAAHSQARGYVDGCWDIMHSGHYNAIRQAKAICGTLVVGVHSDAEIAENKALPVMKQAERYALLEHIKWIDEVLHDVPYSPELATLERARADYCIHGDDMPVNSQGYCAYDGMKAAGKLRIVKRTEGVSTTDLIGRLLTLARQPLLSEGSSPPELRIRTDDAMDQLLPCPDGSLTVCPEAAKDPLELVKALCAKYGMSPEDTNLVKQSVRTSSPAASSSAAGPVPAAAKPNEAGSMLRAKAPVQLLASTRRIGEFASSKQPGETDRIVYVSGSFDMFHVGHAQFLKEAKSLGTFLLVGIHEDSTASRSKDPSFPVMSLNERVLNVCACKWVDEVIIGAPKGVTEDLVKTWDIHVVARGSGHMRNSDLEHGIDHFEVAKQSNMFVEIPSKWPHLNHDTILQRIMSSRQAFLKRNADRAKREDDYYKAKSRRTGPKEV